MSRYVLAHIELPLELFPDGTHKIHTDRSAIHFETMGRLPPIQTNSQIDLAQLLQLSSPSPETSISKVHLDENIGGDDTIVFKDAENSDTETSDGSDVETSDEPLPVSEDLAKALEKQYAVYKHEILPRRPKSNRYTFRQRPKHHSSLYSRKQYSNLET